MNPTELRVNRKNTTRFIAERPSALVLIPRTRERNAGAGYSMVDGEPRTEQTFRIIEQGSGSTPPIRTRANGKQREARFVLLGEHDAAIANGDYWTSEDGRMWEVGDIVRSNGYETRALVAERGE